MKDILLYFQPTIAQIIRYFLFAGGAFLIFYKLFPKAFTKNRIQERFAKPKDFLREIAHSMQTSIIIGITISAIVFTPIKEYTQIYTNMSDFPMWWIPVSVVLALVVHDTYFYWMHRLLHHPKIYKQTHLLHHKSINPSPWASYSFHAIEGFTEALIIPIIMFLMPMHVISLALFGLSSFLINVYGHLGFEVMPKWFRKTWLFELYNTSVHHNLHHEQFNGNYGLYFRVWDRIMGTEHPDYVKRYDEMQEKRFGKSKAVTTKVTSKLAKLPVIILLCSLPFSMFGQSNIEGKWKDIEKGGTILVYQEGGQYFGQLIAADDPEDNAKLEGKTIMVMEHFEQKNDKEWCCGKMYEPELNITLSSANLKLIDPSTLKVKGWFGFISGTRIWKRM